MTGELLLGIVVVALASHRLARAITTDTISDRPRAWVYERAFQHPSMIDTGGLDWLEADEVEAGIIPPPEERVAPEAQTKSYLWALVYGLMSCPHCCGFWLSLIGWAIWWNGHGVSMISAVAVAGLQSIFAAKGMGGE